MDESYIYTIEKKKYGHPKKEGRKLPFSHHNFGFLPQKLLSLLKPFLRPKELFSLSLNLFLSLNLKLLFLYPLNTTKDRDAYAVAKLAVGKDEPGSFLKAMSWGLVFQSYLLCKGRHSRCCRPSRKKSLQSKIRSQRDLRVPPYASEPKT